VVVRHIAAAPLDKPFVTAVDALAAALVDDPGVAVAAIDERPLLLVGPSALVILDARPVGVDTVLGPHVQAASTAEVDDLEVLIRGGLDRRRLGTRPGHETQDSRCRRDEPQRGKP